MTWIRTLFQPKPNVTFETYCVTLLNDLELALGSYAFDFASQMLSFLNPSERDLLHVIYAKVFLNYAMSLQKKHFTQIQKAVYLLLHNVPQKESVTFWKTQFNNDLICLALEFKLLNTVTWLLSYTNCTMYFNDALLGSVTRFLRTNVCICNSDVLIMLRQMNLPSNRFCAQMFDWKRYNSWQSASNSQKIKHSSMLLRLFLSLQSNNNALFETIWRVFEKDWVSVQELSLMCYAYGLTSYQKQFVFRQNNKVRKLFQQLDLQNAFQTKHLVVYFFARMLRIKVTCVTWKPIQWIKNEFPENIMPFHKEHRDKQVCYALQYATLMNCLRGGKSIPCVRIWHVYYESFWSIILNHKQNNVDSLKQFVLAFSKKQMVYLLVILYNSIDRRFMIALANKLRSDKNVLKRIVTMAQYVQDTEFKQLLQ